MKKKGMLVFVYRNNLGDCTADGITAAVDKIILVGVDGPFEVKDGEPYLELKRKVGSRNDDYIYAVPVNFGDVSGLVGPMFGGNFVYTSDSRFRQVCAYPIPVHDRWESQETYDALSR